jgi:eukaryotic-like serine/threonine-protein kinase
MFADEIHHVPLVPVDSRPFRVLTVTADARIQRALNVLWREHDVIACADGGVAAPLALERDVDAVLCDQHVAPAQGVELLTQIREVHPRALRMLLCDRPDARLLLDAVNESEVFRIVDQPWDNAALRDAALAAMRAARLAPPISSSPLSADEGERVRRLNAVVVIESDAATQQRLRDLLQAHYKMHFANTLDRALQFMEQHETGALVCSVGPGRAELVAALKALKQAHPHMAAIVIDPLNDLDRVIELVNEAQIFRLLRRPFNPSLCRPFVDAALARYWHIKQQPQGAWRVAPAEPSPPRATEQLPPQLLNRIRGLPGRLHESEASA